MDAADRAGASTSPRRGRRGRPTPEAAADLTRLIQDVAREEFLALGYAGCSIDRIARVCGINKHTFYRRFATKEELFLSLFWQILDQFFASLAESEHDSGDALFRLKTLARGVLESCFRPEFVGLVRVVISDRLISPVVRTGFLAAREGGVVERVDRHLALAQSRGQLVSGSLPLMRDILLSTMTGSMLLPHLILDERFRTQAERDVMFEYLWSAFVRLFGATPDEPRPLCT